MATLMKRIEDPREISDPNVVKVVTDLAGDAIYFSRCPIPFATREGTRRSLQTYRVCMCTGAIFCSPIPVFR